MRLNLLAFLLVSSASPALAQTTFTPSTILPPASVTTTQIGNTGFSNGMVGGQPYSSTSQRIGNTTFTNGMIGGDTFSGVETSIPAPTPDP